MSKDRFSKLDEVVFGNLHIRERLAHEIIYPEDDRPSVLTISFIEKHPAVHGLLNASVDAIFESIADLIALLSGFPPVDFDIMMLDVDGVTSCFAETRTHAQKTFLRMGPIVALSRSIENEGVVAQIESLDCRVPDSVVDYLRWISDCVTCCDVVCEAVGVRRELDWFSLLPEDVELKPANIRVLRCFDREDPVARRSCAPCVPCPDFERADVVLEDGSFHLPEKMQLDTDRFIGYFSEEVPSVELCPIDNYAQLIYELIEAREEDPEEVRDVLSEYRGRYIISNERDLIQVPMELLAAVGLNGVEPIPCTLASTDKLYELYEPNAYNEFLEGVELPLELFM